MFQKDYILRMIEMIGDLIAAIQGKIRNSDYKEASDLISNIYSDFLREDASFFRKIPEQDLTTKLLRDHNYTNGHLAILSELFNIEAELSLAEGNRSGSLECSRKALILLQFLDAEEKTYFQERIDKMDILKKRIEELSNNETLSS